MEEDINARVKADRIKEGEFREWYFPKEEVLEWTQKFIQVVGYEIQPKSYIGFVQPDFHAKRQTEKNTYEVFGIVEQHFDKAVEAYTKLLSIKAIVGESADYVLVLPPVSEYLMIEFFDSYDGQWYLEIKRHKFMLWLANPDEEYVWGLVGGPLDRLFEEYFALGKFPLDPILSSKYIKQVWEAEEE